MKAAGKDGMWKKVFDLLPKKAEGQVYFYLGNPGGIGGIEPAYPFGHRVFDGPRAGGAGCHLSKGHPHPAGHPAGECGQ